MNTSKHFICFLLFVSQFTTTSWSQNTFQLGALPAVNINKKLENDWSLNLKAESRQVLQRGTFGGSSTNDYEYVLTDLTFITAKKVGLNSRIAGGYLLRFEGNELVHRSIQQFTMVSRMSGYRLSNRFVTDQTFTELEKPEFRLRYRLAAEIPLNGASVDVSELYLRLSNEYLNSWQDGEYDLEVRLVPLLGYFISDANKVELGLDYRINSFIESGSRQNYWMTINWFIEL